MNTAIEKLYRDGKKASEIFKLLKGSVSRSGVFKAVKRFKETWAKIESKTIRATCDQVISRLRRVIIEKGGYIE